MPVRPVDERCFGGICCEVIHDCSSGVIRAIVAGSTAATKGQVRNRCFFDVNTKCPVTSRFAAGRQCSRTPDQNFRVTCHQRRVIVAEGGLAQFCGSSSWRCDPVLVGHNW